VGAQVTGQDDRKIIALVPRSKPSKREPVQDVVDLLRGLLARAEAGLIRGLAFAGYDTDDDDGAGVMSTGWRHDTSGASLHGDSILATAITILQHRYVHEYLFPEMAPASPTTPESNPPEQE
jgi:hypothetical protein